MIKEIDKLNFHILVQFLIIEKGKIILISTSKIIKVIAIIKNWIENIDRDFDNLSNPHS